MARLARVEVFAADEIAIVRWREGILGTQPIVFGVRLHRRSSNSRNRLRAGIGLYRNLRI